MSYIDEMDDIMETAIRRQIAAGNMDCQPSGDTAKYLCGVIDRLRSELANRYTGSPSYGDKGLGRQLWDDESLTVEQRDQLIADHVAAVVSFHKRNDYAQMRLDAHLENEARLAASEARVKELERALRKVFNTLKSYHIGAHVYNIAEAALADPERTGGEGSK